MGKPSSSSIEHPRDTTSQPTANPYVGRFKETILLCIFDIYAGCALSRSSAVDLETRGLIQVSLLCASMGAICVTLLFSHSNIMRGIDHSPGSTDGTNVRRWQRWTALSPAFWAVCGCVLLVPSALSHFCGTHFPPISPTHVRTASMTVLILGITCIAAIVASFSSRLRRSLD